MTNKLNNNLIKNWSSPKPNMNSNLPVIIVGHAVRNKSKDSGNLYVTSTSLVTQNQNKISSQIKEALRNASASVASQKNSCHLPLNMIVSKVARRTPLVKKTEEINPLQNFDVSFIRNTKTLTPPWKTKKEYTKTYTKRLQHVYLHNKRMAEQFQAKKSNDNTRYDPTDASQGLRDRDFEKWLLGSKLRNDEGSSQAENFRQLYGCSPDVYMKSLATYLNISSEDPYPSNVPTASLRNQSTYRKQQEISGDPKVAETYQLARTEILEQESENSLFEDDKLKQKENFKFDLTPALQKSKEVFVWNPVIVPVNQWPRFENEEEDEDYRLSYDEENSDFLSESDRYNFDTFNSPGNHTVSSSSSCLTVAEERIQFTYFATRGRPTPKSTTYNNNHLENPTNLFPGTHSQFNWSFQRSHSDFDESSEE